MLPCQFTNIQFLDITLQQVALEGGFLYDLPDFFLGSTGYTSEARQEGVHIAPDLGQRIEKEEAYSLAVLHHCLKIAVLASYILPILSMIRSYRLDLCHHYPRCG